MRSLFLFLLACSPLGSNHAIEEPPLQKNYSYRVVATVPHSEESFTQGLVIEGDLLWESSGLYRRSFLELRHKGRTAALQTFRYPNRHFAEGITILGNYLYGLTWKSGVVYRWDKYTLTPAGRYEIDGEGWGMTRWKGQLVTSNGSATLTFRSASNLSEERTVTVTRDGRNQSKINDLTADDTSLWANVWHSSSLLRIDPDTGQVIGTLELHALAIKNQKRSMENVLNGVAWDSSSNTLWVTGKRWPNMYQLEIKD